LAYVVRESGNEVAELGTVALGAGKEVVDEALRLARPDTGEALKGTR
jgi:hypothetical protein